MRRSVLRSCGRRSRTWRDCRTWPPPILASSARTRYPPRSRCAVPEEVELPGRRRGPMHVIRRRKCELQLHAVRDELPD